MIDVHLDTDIGDDIDDVFCLALLLQCPELALSGVTTAWGRTGERCDIVADLCSQVALAPPIAGGFAVPMASRRFHDDLLLRLIYPFDGPSKFRTDAVEALRLITAVPEDGVILTIGAMTNAAAAMLARDKREPFPRIIAMAGEFQRYGHIEFNIRCDPEAAHVCFSRGTPIDVIPWSIGPATKLLPSDIDRIRASDTPLCRRVFHYLQSFWKHVPNKTNMYDPMTVVALLKPELFDWKRGHVAIELRGEHTYGQTTFREDPGGPHRVAFGVQAEAANAFLIDRLTGTEAKQ